jgi:NAD(P)-dependent dehydrogenase (short-subunit alcohol dehydrogenase family)
MKTQRGSVVITGASSGIGRASALHLARTGYQVFAGVRREEDAKALLEEGMEELLPLNLEVTDEASIAAAEEVVREGMDGRSLALVNNAGLSLNGPLELVPFDAMKRVFEVNVLGLMAVTRAFLPLLRETGGRLINVSSGHGKLAVPDKSVYAASKFAVGAVSDALRVELRPFGVTVTDLIVGKVDTEVLGKILEAREAMVAQASPEIVELYRPLVEFFDREVRNLPGIPPLEVAKVMAEAIEAKTPKPEYLVGPGARKMRNLGRLPRGLRDGLMYKAIYGSHKP